MTQQEGRARAALAHYTTLQGFMGIVSSQTVWASHVSFLNDQREMVHALDDAIELLTVLAGQEEYRVWAEDLEAVAKRLRDVDSLPPTYVACFCEDPDLLSQWRGYGDNTQGIALEFPRGYLRPYFPGTRMERVIYTGDETVEKLLPLLTDEFFFLQDVEKAFGLEPGERESMIFRTICGLLPRFKHRGFEEEREWRFFVQGAMVPDEVEFRVRNSHLVPYVKLKTKQKRRLPLSRVVIGPGANFDVTERSVRLFLERHGYGRVQIDRSATPYRT